MTHPRSWYEDTLREWLQSIEALWNEEQGRYDTNGVAVPYWDAKLIVPLAVFARKGENWATRRIGRILKSMLGSPPWDEKERLWSNSYQQLGRPPHGANAPIDSGLCFAVRYAEELGLDPADVGEILRRIKLSLQRWAETGEGAERFSHQVFLDRDDRQIDLIAAWNESQAKGLPMDLSFVRERGPANQVCFQMRAAMHAYLATRDEEFLGDVHKLWNRVLQTGVGDESRPYRATFDEDWSFRYNNQPLHDYEMSVYDVPMIGMFADVIRMLRQVGKSEPRFESFFSKWCHASLTRAHLLDGSTNMAFDLYGPDRIGTNEVYGQSIWLHALISIADLAPLPPEEIRHFFDLGIERFTRWGFIKASPDIGIEGWQESSGIEELAWEAYEIALMLLTNEDALSVESRPPNRCTAGFAWRERYFVRQTPAYHLTVIGASPGFDGKWGASSSGGEYVIRLPYGDYLVPLSDFGRPSLKAWHAGKILSSSDITVDNSDHYSVKMTASSPGFGMVERGEPYAMPFADVSCDEASVRLEFEESGVKLKREIRCLADRLIVTDSVVAEAGIIVVQAASYLPIITTNPRGESCQALGLPESFLTGNEHAWLSKAETIDIRYPHYGFTITQQSEGRTLLSLGPAWREEQRMNVSGRSIQCVWLAQSAHLLGGEEKRFQYEIRPYSDGYVL